MEAKKILVIDDEQIARDRICRFLREANTTLNVRQANNGLEALEIIHAFKPDVIFLDVQMPGLTGFEVLQQIETRDFQIVFQTAYDEYALKAFEESACDYVLKPFSKDRFEKALNKALTAHSQVQSLKQLESSMHHKNLFLDKITYKQGGKIKILQANEIICFVSQDHYTCAYDKFDIEHVIDFSISFLEEHLNPEQFIRCHRNNIVAIEQLKSVGGTGDSHVELKSGRTLPLSRANRNAVLLKAGRVPSESS